jgi:hypothetical protein
MLMSAKLMVPYLWYQPQMPAKGAKLLKSNLVTNPSGTFFA